MKSMLRNELPSDVLGGEKSSNGILGPLILQEVVEFLNLACSPNKLVPQSLQMSEGQPRQAINLLRQAMNAFDVRSETNSK